MDHLNKTMIDLVTPEKNVSIDESMTLWRGRNNRQKYGIKFLELCTHDGLVLTDEDYGGEGFQDPNNLGQTRVIVLKLIKPYLNKGYYVFTDNYYNSVQSTGYLSSKSSYIAGTLRKDRKSNPKELTARKLSKGQMNFRSRRNITLCKWKDKRDILMISNTRKSEMVYVSNGHGKAKQKPNMIRDYSEFIPSINRSDQMLSFYSAFRKTLRYKKCVNLYRKFAVINKGISHLVTLREVPIKGLTGQRKMKVTERPATNLHYLVSIQDKQAGKKATRKCRRCN